MRLFQDPLETYVERVISRKYIAALRASKKILISIVSVCILEELLA